MPIVPGVIGFRAGGGGTVLAEELVATLDSATVSATLVPSEVVAAIEPQAFVLTEGPAP